MSDEDISSLAFSRMIDVSTFCVILIVSIMVYYRTDREKKYEILENVVYNTEKLIKGPSKFILVFSIIALYLIIYMSGIPMTSDTKSFTVIIFESFLWLFLLLVIYMELVKFLFDKNLPNVIFDNLRRFISNSKNRKTKVKVGEEDTTETEEDTTETEEDTSETTGTKEGKTEEKTGKTEEKTGKTEETKGKTEEKTGKTEEKKGTRKTKTNKKGTTGFEVFHVSNNLYNYEDAQSICKSFDS
jgi:hypothetical protein